MLLILQNYQGILPDTRRTPSPLKIRGISENSTFRRLATRHLSDENITDNKQ